MKQIFKNSIIHKPSLGSLEVPQKIGPDRFSRFDVYWIQTDKQSIYISRYIYKLAIADQKAGPNWIKFLEETHWYSRSNNN